MTADTVFAIFSTTKAIWYLRAPASDPTTRRLLRRTAGIGYDFFKQSYLRMATGMPKSWALTFMLNDEDAPTGRPAGELAWAGLANLYYWIDRSTGIGGFWATQILPFADPASVGGYLDFEKAVYDVHRAVSAA